MINISIKSNSMVIPSKPTPNGLLQLSEIDQAAQWTHAPVIHIYKPNNNIPSSFEKTKNALAQRCDLENNEIPFLDRTVLKSSEPLMKPRFDHIAYTTKSPFVIRSLDAKEGQKKETMTSKCLYGDLLSKPLSYSTRKLREAIETVTDEYTRSNLDFIASQKHVDGLRFSFRISSGNMLLY
ncbi:hypothetical protein CFP56_003805 [Quercus suber]|uniref:Uncharacterized protein n=1 Tax=Quercus suber TaxID=58331 RepID=A0AAW0LFF7_QUESU